MGNALREPLQIRRSMPSRQARTFERLLFHVLYYMPFSVRGLSDRSLFTRVAGYSWRERSASRSISITNVLEEHPCWDLVAQAKLSGLLVGYFADGGELQALIASVQIERDVVARLASFNGAAD